MHCGKLGHRYMSGLFIVLVVYMVEEAMKGLNNTKAARNKMFHHDEFSVEKVVDMGKVSFHKMVEDQGASFVEHQGGNNDTAKLWVVEEEMFVSDESEAVKAAVATSQQEYVDEKHLVEGGDMANQLAQGLGKAATCWSLRWLRSRLTWMRWLFTRTWPPGNWSSAPRKART